VLLTTPVLEFVAFTAALGTTACDESVTVPAMLPVVVWALAAGGIKFENTTRQVIWMTAEYHSAIIFLAVA
jgi:hypothetical protein